MIHYAAPDARPAGFALALEQVVLERASESAFWLWRDEPAVVLGRHQDAAAEADLAEAARRGVPVFRRKTGGGAVFHDLGTVQFSFVVPAATPVRRVLASFVALLGASAFATDRNDVLAPDGRKIAGTAQMLSGSRRLFHGTLLWDADLGALARLLTPPEAKLRRHGVPSVRSRVANLRDLLGSPLFTDEFFARLRLRASRSWAGPLRPVPAPWLAEAESISRTPPFLPIPSNLHPPLFKP